MKSNLQQESSTFHQRVNKTFGANLWRISKRLANVSLDTEKNPDLFYQFNLKNTEKFWESCPLFCFNSLPTELQAPMSCGNPASGSVLLLIIWRGGRTAACKERQQSCEQGVMMTSD